MPKALSALKCNVWEQAEYCSKGDKKEIMNKDEWMIIVYKVKCWSDGTEQE